MKSQGVTLVELIVGMTVSVLVGGLILSILVNNAAISYKQSAKVTQGVGVNDVLSSIAANIKQASAVASGYPASSPTYSSSGTQLVLKLPSVDSNGDTITGASDYVVYLRDVDKIRLKLFPSANPPSKRNSEDRILSFNASDLKFEYFDGTGASVTPTSAVKVKVTVTLSQKTGSGTQTDTASIEAELRND